MQTWTMAAALLVAAPALKERPTPVEPPVGRWVVERLESDGVALIKPPDRHAALQFADKSFGLELYGLRPTMTQADFYEVAGQRVMEYWPIRRDLPVRAIWKVDGDTLTLCEGHPGDPRPTGFSAPKGSKRALWILKRVKE